MATKKKVQDAVAGAEVAPVYTLKIGDIGRDREVESGLEVITVAVQIMKDDTVDAERNFSYPLGTTEEAIREDLQKVLLAYKSDQVIAADTQRSEELESEAQEIKENLEGEELS